MTAFILCWLCKMVTAMTRALCPLLATDSTHFLQTFQRRLRQWDFPVGVEDVLQYALPATHQTYRVIKSKTDPWQASIWARSEVTTPCLVVVGISICSRRASPLKIWNQSIFHFTSSRLTVELKLQWVYTFNTAFTGVSLAETFTLLCISSFLDVLSMRETHAPSRASSPCVDHGAPDLSITCILWVSSQVPGTRWGFHSISVTTKDSVQALGELAVGDIGVRKRFVQRPRVQMW